MIDIKVQLRASAMKFRKEAAKAHLAAVFFGPEHLVELQAAYLLIAHDQEQAADEIERLEKRVEAAEKALAARK